ncbi:MAG: helix-turn-helix transcriptional regulator [Salinarimonas sp.]
MTVTTALQPGALRRARQLRGMKQSHLAELVGVRQGTVSKWESGLALPSPAQARRLATLFAARLDAQRDAWIRRLVEGSRRPVHLMCESTHRLLAASPMRVLEWRRDPAEVAAEPLLRAAPDDLRRAEALVTASRADAQESPPFVVRTAGRRGGQYEVAPALLLWESLQLSGGEWVRLVSNIAEDEVPLGAIAVG